MNRDSCIRNQTNKNYQEYLKMSLYFPKHYKILGFYVNAFAILVHVEISIVHDLTVDEIRA